MNASIDKVRDELESLGYETETFSSGQGDVVAFDYIIETGTHKGKIVTVGVSFQGSQNYPEYPPHWIHITPPIDDNRGGSVQPYSDTQGRQWLAMSRPPEPIWDRLRTKHMSIYLSEHLRRIWAEL